MSTVRLEKHYDQRFKDLEDKMNMNKAAQAEATRHAAEALEHRLDGMNEFRDQLSKERGQYVTRELFGSETQAHANADKETHTDIDRRLRALETVVANYAGRIWAIGAGITLLNLAIAAFGLWLLWK